MSVLSLVDGPVELCVTRLRYPQNHGLLCGQMSTAKRQPPTSLLVADRQPGYHDRARGPDISRVALQFAAKPKAANPQSDAEQRSDEAAIHAAAGILTSINKANAKCDAQAASALYAEDATMILSDGLLSGRAAIGEAYAQFYERSSSHPSKLEHVVAIGDDMMLRAGSWSHTYQGPADLAHQRGSWTTTDVLRGTTWQIHPETSFTHSRSSVPTVRLR